MRLFFAINIETLLIEKGQISTVPSELYEIDEDGKIELLEIVHDSLEVLNNDVGGDPITDDDWALLLEESDDAAQIVDADYGEPYSVIPDVPYQPPVETESKPGPSGLCKESQNSKLLKKRRRVVIADENEDDICFTKKGVGVSDYVLIKNDEEPIVGVVEQKDPLKGFQVHTLVNFNGANFFKWSTGPRLWYKDVHCILSEPEPANNRSAWKLNDTDYVKYKDMKSS